MLVDTHCHLNHMVKGNDLNPLSAAELMAAKKIVEQAVQSHVTQLISVGTTLRESNDCITLAKAYPEVFAVIGIHPNDLTDSWKEDLKIFDKQAQEKELHKIVGIGECGIDLYYKQVPLARQSDAFKAQIELALTHDLALVIHSRDAYDETLKILEQYKHDIKRLVIHCFSYDQHFADQIIAWGWLLGIGGTVTYPKNEALRSIVSQLPLDSFVLETDAPFLPIQTMRGKQNHPCYIKEIAEYCAQLRAISFEEVAHATTKNAQQLFQIISPNY